MNMRIRRGRWDSAETARQFGEKLRQLIPCSAVAIRIVDPLRSSGTIVAVTGDSYAASFVRQTVSLENMSRKVRVGDPDDFQAGEAGTKYLESFLYVPLADGRKLRGSLEFIGIHAVSEVTKELANLAGQIIEEKISKLNLSSEIEGIALTYRRKNQELSVLREVSNKILGSNSVETILFTVLTAITSGYGLGFNRALALLVDKEMDNLVGAFGIGANRSEVERIWKEQSERYSKLEEQFNLSRPIGARSEFDSLVRGVEVPLVYSNSILARVVHEKRTFNIRDASDLWGFDRAFVERIETKSFAVVPILSQNEVIGALVVDNIFTRKPIFDSELDFLETIANHCGLAIHGAQAVEELNAAMDQLEDTTEKLVDAERLAAIGEISAGVAHEIRNPLTAISGFSRRLAKRLKGDETGLRYTRIIEKEIARLENLAHEVLGLAASRKNVFQERDLLHLVRQWRDTNEQMLLTRKIRVRIESPVVMAKVDQLLIGQAITNILTNAAYSMSDGGTISCRGFQDPEEVVLEITDTGCGMNKETVENALKPFFTTKREGTGLGLSLAKKAVRAHGGVLRFSSVENVGTSVQIRIPKK